jgi:large subunit ribosomal protein L15
VAEKADKDKDKGTARSEEIGLHNLKPKPGSKKPRKRIGRGEGSGLG